MDSWFAALHTMSIQSTKDPWTVYSTLRWEVRTHGLMNVRPTNWHAPQRKGPALYKGARWRGRDSYNLEAAVGEQLHGIGVGDEKLATDSLSLSTYPSLMACLSIVQTSSTRQNRLDLTHSLIY